jgi:hypothetical protein
MKRCPPLRAVTIAATLLVALLAVSAYAQFQTGNIYGKVVSKDGSALPGVTVTLSGVGAPQIFITDAGGAFRFVNLSPGNYDLKAELGGFGTSVRQGVRVSIGAVADVTMTMNPSVSESITVTAAAPLLDVRKTGTGADVSRVELDKVPSARDPWVILQQTPGVIMDRNNVGGNESGQQSVYVSKGTTGTQSSWNVDGVSITDFAASGSSPTYYDFDAFEEMQITTGGTDPRIQTAGVQINMVTKRGTNDFKGSGRFFQTKNAWQADPSIPSEAAAYLARINEINKIDDQGFEVGGPIWKDRVWFWGAYGEQKIDILTAALVAGARFRDKTSLKNENLKFNAQPFASNSLTVVDQFGAKIKLGRNVSTARFPETGWNQDNFYGGGTGSLTSPTLWKIEDTQLFGPNLYLTGLYSKVQGGFQLIADNGKGCKTYACGLDSLPAYRDDAGDGAWHRSYLSVFSNRPQKQYRLDGSYFANTGSLSHELKFGYGYREAAVTSTTGWPGGSYTYNYGSGAGDGNDTGMAVFPRYPLFTYSAKSTDLYVGDTMLFGNLTVQAGLRYDIQKGANSAGTAAADAVVPEILQAITFPSVGGLKWSTISPRLGLTYTLGADRRTLLRGAYSRYVDQMQSNTVFPASPGASSYAYYYFNDLNHDNIAQHSEIDFNYGIVSHVGFDPANPTVSTQFTRWASNLKAPHTDEFILGLEREILTDLSVGVNGTYRKLNDFIVTTGEHTQGQSNFYSPADYVLHAPVVATLPNGTTVSLPYYTLAPGVSAPVYRVIRNRPDYSQSYKGLELNATKRMSNRWMLRGNFTLQDWKQDVGPGSFSDPTIQRVAGGTACPNCNGDQVIFQSTGSGSKGAVYINSKWAYSVTGVYQVPVIETSLGFNLNERQGYALPYVWRVNGAGGEGTKLLIVPNHIDEFRNSNVTELDLRVAKEIRVSRVGLTLSVDAFNVLNANTILQRNVTRLNALAASNQVTEVLSPRVFRVGARLSF